MLEEFKERVMKNTTLSEKFDQLLHYYPVYVALVIFCCYYGLFWLCFLTCDRAQRAMFRYFTREVDNSTEPTTEAPGSSEAGHTNPAMTNEENSESA